MATAYCEGVRPRPGTIPLSRALDRCESSVSIIVFPTKKMRSGETPSTIRLASASRDDVNSISDNWSVARRLSSSGMERSRLLRPAST